jgi:hypothetical protein
VSHWDTIRTQNEIDSLLIQNFSDISHKANKGRREKGRGFNNSIVNVGTLPFQVTRLAAAGCLHTAVALELSAG